MNSWNAADLYFDADTFSGVARLFPLPNLVLYPHVMQPLHIFEDRYREMLEDVAGDRPADRDGAVGARLGDRLREPPAGRAATPAWARS